MKLVADANILFSCLLKGGVTRRLWNHPNITLCAPSFIIEEFKKYEPYLRKKYSGTTEEFNKLVHALVEILFLIPEKGLEPYVPAAATLSNDKKDWFYLACALKEDAALWSNDAEFKKQSRIKVYTTTELAEQIGIL